jgi:lysophospholipase L1-like esterase
MHRLVPALFAAIALLATALPAAPQVVAPQGGAPQGGAPQVGAPQVVSPQVVSPQAVSPQVAITSDLTVSWEVKSRFRLFRYESDFLKHVDADRGDGLLAAEQRLARATEGHGWARTMLNGLCVDALGRLVEVCERDGEKENYLAPTDHKVGVLVPNAPPGASCAWTFDNGEDPAQAITVPCTEEVRLRVRYGRPTVATADIPLPDGSIRRATTEILVRDLLIAGLGDSVASGEGNPDRQIVLSDDGFCFRRFFAGSHGEYFRPSRAGYKGNKSCGGGGAHNDPGWANQRARWMSPACHRSLYGYQVRTALALAVQNPHVAVSFIPLACSGARIVRGLLDSQGASEIVCPPRGSCPKTVPPQLAQLREALNLARRSQPNRSLDLILLTIGANDIHFSEVVADAIIEQSAERAVLKRGGYIASIEDAQDAMTSELPGNFARLREALKSFVGRDLSRVVYVSYSNPALQPGGTSCPGGRDGFDIHPAFALNAEALRRAATFVERSFLPRLKALALCQGGVMCGGAADRMTFVDAHQIAFADHGVCARAPSDPQFDQDCFSPAGESFHKSPVEGAAQPLRCGRSVREFRAYAPRARWIRTANDSYFTAMSYPEGLGPAQPADIHDATWGVVSAVYGGAVHPTAEGHAVMADAALESATRALGLPTAQSSVTTAPLPPPIQ